MNTLKTSFWGEDYVILLFIEPLQFLVFFFPLTLYFSIIYFLQFIFPLLIIYGELDVNLHVLDSNKNMTNFYILSNNNNTHETLCCGTLIKIILDFGFFIEMENNYLWLSYILRPNGNHKILIQKDIDLFKADTLFK